MNLTNTSNDGMRVYQNFETFNKKHQELVKDCTGTNCLNLKSYPFVRNLFEGFLNSKLNKNNFKADPNPKLLLLQSAVGSFGCEMTEGLPRCDGGNFAPPHKIGTPIHYTLQLVKPNDTWWKETLVASSYAHGGYSEKDITHFYLNTKDYFPDYHNYARFQEFNKILRYMEIQEAKSIKPFLEPKLTPKIENHILTNQSLYLNESLKPQTLNLQDNITSLENNTTDTTDLISSDIANDTNVYAGIGIAACSLTLLFCMHKIYHLVKNRLNASNPL